MLRTRSLALGVCAPFLGACPRATTPASPTFAVIYPTPIAVTSGPWRASVRTACVDTQSLASHATLDPLVPRFLADAGLAAGAASGCDWTLSFATGEPPLSGAARDAWAAHAASDERYAVVTSVIDAQHASSALYAQGERAASYALHAALDLAAPADAGLGVGDATVADAPAFPWRGLVEGIYGAKHLALGPAYPGLGTQYSPDDRALLVRLVARLRGNTYIYGPKNDPFARTLPGAPSGITWRTPYPADLAAAMTAVAREADANLVRFVWSLSPGSDFDFASPTGDTAAAVAKLDAMRALGVHTFALFFDDDTRQEATAIAAQAALANALDANVRAHDPSSHLLLVWWDYSGSANASTDAFGAALSSDVEVMWTGPHVRSCTITASDLAPIDASLRRTLSLWDNWPIDHTDTGSGHSCGDVPIRMTGRAPDLPSVAGGYYENPVIDQDTSNSPNLPLASFLDHLGPIADYAWGAPTYAPDASYTAWGSIKASRVAAASR